MRRFVEGADRGQTTLFPECLEDWIGAPSYHPSVLLKLYIYGYLNRVQSSRRLEHEAGRNVEVMWLTGRLAPDHKTIADFRKEWHGHPQSVPRFVALCRTMGLLTQASVAIDGSKFKAVNNRDKNFTRAKMERRMAQIEESVARYLQQLDSADRQEPSEALKTKTSRLKEKIEKLKEQMRRLEDLKVQMLATPDQQISLTDPNSRSMATSGRGSGVVGYNVQVAVDTKHHLIITHEVTNIGTDRSQLAHVANEAKAALDVEKLDAVADRGYFNSEEILRCEEAGITVTLPKPMTSNSKAEGRFGKQDFRYYQLCWASLQALSRAKWHQPYDAWITLVLAKPPMKIGMFDLEETDLMKGWLLPFINYIPFTAWQNVTGQPAISLPLAWSKSGLPIGIQFVGRFGEEHLLLQLAAQIEKAEPWSKKRPPGYADISNWIR